MAGVALSELFEPVNPNNESVRTVSPQRRAGHTAMATTGIALVAFAIRHGGERHEEGLGAKFVSGGRVGRGRGAGGLRELELEFKLGVGRLGIERQRDVGVKRVGDVGLLRNGTAGRPMPASFRPAAVG